MGVTNKKTLTKTRRKTRDVDQIAADLQSPAHLARHTSLQAAEDLPGLGRYYCVACAKWFETVVALGGHRRGKPHKRRLKQLADEPYSQKEAEAAGGVGVSPAPKQKTRSIKEVAAAVEVAGDMAMASGSLSTVTTTTDIKLDVDMS